MNDEQPISYDPALIPEPITGQEMYLKAILVELRAIRRLVERAAHSADKTARATSQAAKAVTKR